MFFFLRCAWHEISYLFYLFLKQCLCFLVDFEELRKNGGHHETLRIFVAPDEPIFSSVRPLGLNLCPRKHMYIMCLSLKGV